MAFWNRKERREATFTQSEPRSFLEIVGLASSPTVSVEEALGVPAVWAAVNFLSGTIAGLPLNVYDKRADGEKVKVKANKNNPTVSMLHDAVNDGLSSFQWRYNMFATGVLTDGRFVTYIECNERGQPVNLFPLTGNVVVKQLANGRKTYSQTIGGKTKTYDQGDVIDIPFMLKSDMVSHRSPLRQCAVAIGKAVNSNEYGSKLFKNGGLPSFALQGPFGSKDAAVRGSKDIQEATKEVAQRGGSVLAIPLGHELKPLGGDPEKMQMAESQRFAVEEIARIYSLPPTFLQDLSHGTFSNTEQQDLHFVKHTLRRWLEQLEQEMNLKFFGRDSNRFVEFNVDALLRGDYKTRMEGNSTAIQTGQLTPNEARKMENRPSLEGGDVLYIQGATVPLVGHTGEPDVETPQDDENGEDDET